MMQLSEHFSREEFEASQVAARHGINNRMPDTFLPSAVALCTNVLEQVRAHFGPTWISSGYRCRTLNSMIGGAADSQHQFGQAADLVIPGVSAIDLCHWIYDNVPHFDQLIQEGTWTHVSFSTEHNRRTIMTAHFDANGHATYSDGI